MLAGQLQGRSREYREETGLLREQVGCLDRLAAELGEQLRASEQARRELQAREGSLAERGQQLQDTLEERMAGFLEGEARCRDKDRELKGKDQEIEYLRRRAEEGEAKVTCSSCRENEKNTMLTRCGHLFCKDCANGLITNRKRECPLCSTKLDRGDIKTIILS